MLLDKEEGRNGKEEKDAKERPFILYSFFATEEVYASRPISIHVLLLYRYLTCSFKPVDPAAGLTNNSDR